MPEKLIAPLGAILADLANCTDEQADSIIAHHQPWKIAHAFHEAAVRATPTLHVLIGHMDHWPYEDDREDASMWLSEHATDDQLNQTIVAAGTDRKLTEQKKFYSNPADVLVRALTPPALLTVWHQVVGPAPNDLTDADSPPSQTDPSMPSAGQARSWAQAHGYRVGDRGRLPKKLIQLYQQAQRKA